MFIIYIYIGYQNIITCSQVIVLNMSKAVDKIAEDSASSMILDSRKRSEDSDSLELPDPKRVPGSPFSHFVASRGPWSPTLSFAPTKMYFVIVDCFFPN